MKKVFNVNGHDVEFTTCTAVSAPYSFEGRKDGLFFRDLTGRDPSWWTGLSNRAAGSSGVVFNVRFPKTADDAKWILEWNPIDSDEVTIKSVQLDEAAEEIDLVECNDCGSTEFVDEFTEAELDQMWDQILSGLENDPF